MPKEKSDLRLVAGFAKEGEAGPALRLAKTIRGGDDSSYTFLLPGVVPDPLKLTIHQSGEIHLTSRKAGLITRLDKDVLLKGILSGSLDDTLARFLTPRLSHEAAEGFLIGPELLALTSGTANAPLKDVDFPAVRLMESLTKVRVDDATRVGDAIARLREDGLLPEKAFLQLETERSNEPIAFISLLDRPLGQLPPEIPLPPGFPFPKSFRAMLDSLGKYGGILFTMPSETQIAEMAQVVGLGDLLAGLGRFVEALEEPAVEQKVGMVLGEIVEGFSGPLRKLVRSKPLRPLRAPARTRVLLTPPAGGWVRRRPRRRGHTARLPKPST